MKNKGQEGDKKISVWLFGFGAMINLLTYSPCQVDLTITHLAENQKVAESSILARSYYV
jgi:hypothetical protein